MHPISIAAEKIFTLFGFLPVTNSLLATWIIIPVLIMLALLTTRNMKTVPQGLQNFVEMVFENLQELYGMILGNKRVPREIFYFVTTIFIFILFSNWFGLLPGVGAIGLYEKEVAIEEHIATVEPGEVALTEETTSASHEAGGGHESVFVPLLRAGSSDLSFTIALAACTIFYVQFIGVKQLHFGYFKKFINFSHPIRFFVGLLEIVSEFAKMASFSFRLFGNIFAGEVLLVVVTFLVPYVVPIPFYGLEVFVGAIQAFVFIMLTLTFLKGAVAHH